MSIGIRADDRLDGIILLMTRRGIERSSPSSANNPPVVVDLSYPDSSHLKPPPISVPTRNTLLIHSHNILLISKHTRSWSIYLEDLSPLAAIMHRKGCILHPAVGDRLPGPLHYPWGFVLSQAVAANQPGCPRNYVCGSYFRPRLILCED